MLLYPTTQDIYSIGSMVKALTPPSSKWERCYGQVVTQSAYPKLYSVMKNPHSMRWNNFGLAYDFFSGVPYIFLSNGSVYVAAGVSSFVRYSSDLQNWNTPVSVPAGSYYYGGYANGLFILLGYNSTYAITSPDGSTWTQRTLPASKYWKAVCWDGTYFFAVATNYTSLAYSSDGFSWSPLTGPTGGTGGYSTGIVSDGAGTIVTVCNENSLATSTDHGSTWTQIPINDSFVGNCINYVNGHYLISGWNGGLLISTDGFNWSHTQTFFSDEPSYYKSPRQNVVSAWYYQNGAYFGFPGQETTIPFSQYTYDFKTFYPIHWPSIDWYYWPACIWDSANSRWMFSSSYGEVRYLYEFGYDENTYFQFPFTTGGHSQETGLHWYIKVR